MDAVKDLALWLYEWKLLRSFDGYPESWKRLPKGTPVRLVSTRGLLELFDAVEVALTNFTPESLNNLSLFPSSDLIEPESEYLWPGLSPNKDYTVVAEAVYNKIFATFAKENAMKAMVIWEGITQPRLFLPGPNDPLYVIECLEEKTSVRRWQVSGEETIKDVCLNISKQWESRRGSEPLHPTLWTKLTSFKISTLEARKIDYCGTNSDLVRIPNSSKTDRIFEVLNSTKLFIEHRIPLEIFEAVSEHPSLGVGLENLGQTCFLNATLQCLIHMPLFAMYIQHEYPASENETLLGDFLRELLIKEYICKLGDRPFAPSKILSKLRQEHPFADGEQEDANELFHILLEVLSKDIPPRQLTPPPVSHFEEVNFWIDILTSDSPVRTELFGGVQKHRLQCGLCLSEQVKYMHFCSLPLDLPHPRCFTVTVVRQDVIAKQEVFKIDSSTSLEENEIIQNVREQVAHVAGITNFLFGENRRMLLEDSIGLSNMISCTSFIALELPTLDISSHAVLVDFYISGKGAATPLCTRVIKIHRATHLSALISDISYFLVQVEEIVNEARLLWMLNKRNEQIYQSYRTTSTLEFVSLDENRTAVSIASLVEQGMDTVGELVLNLGEKLPRFRFISSAYSSGAENLLRMAVQKDWAWKAWFGMGADHTLITTLLQMMTYTFREKPLNEEDSLLCVQCGKRTQHIVHLDIVRFPRLLPLVLQRVRIQPTGLEKSFIRIQYPLRELDLSSMESGPAYDPPVYDLQAVLTHDGSSILKGHYLAYALNPVTNSWVRYNDKSVERVNELQAVQEQGAYMLFYARRFR